MICKHLATEGLLSPTAQGNVTCYRRSHTCQVSWEAGKESFSAPVLSGYSELCQTQESLFLKKKKEEAKTKLMVKACWALGIIHI